ncbi:MAG TPA: DUF952 domain-containing protein [Polyangiaceae bacterium]|nr:DUF952 domain-containing protein [Polyangiaceae bacterium]
MAATVYKIMRESEWREASAAGRFEGSAVDRRDGFIHLSTATQVEETARRHFAGQTDLVLLAFDAASLGEALRYEPSRGGELFPHLYAPLTASVVRKAAPLPWDGTRHVFPPLEP